ncbi:MAG: hypothetical protein RLZ22_877 [Verrucomicrobiota bacterium]
METRNYASPNLLKRVSGDGIGVIEAISGREQLTDAWIPGVEVIPRKVYPQKGRGHFSELARMDDGVLSKIGLTPSQWASALMHRDSAKGFHIHPPYLPDDIDPADWFRQLYIEHPDDYSRRPYGLEQWDVMFFLTGVGEMILVDERDGMTRRVMRLIISGDTRSGPDTGGVVIPPGVGHAIRSIGAEDLITVYGTSTSFNPQWEGRIATRVEDAALPDDWIDHLEWGI